MNRHEGRSPGHATVVAYLALFLALGGAGAYAISKITADEIKRNAVRAKHIKRGNVNTSELGDGAVVPAKLDLTESDQQAGPVTITGVGSQPLGPSVALDVPPGGTVFFEAKADVARSSDDVECDLHATSGPFSEFLFRADVGFGGPAEPARSGLVPSHPPMTGKVTYELEGSLSGLTNESCTFNDIEFYAYVLR